MLTEAATQGIVSNGGKGPFAHTCYPIGGFDYSSASTGFRQRLQTQIEHALLSSVLPDFLPVSLPTANNSSVSSPNDRVSPSRAASRQAEEHDLPPRPDATADFSKTVSAPTAAEEHEPSDQVKNFLRRIPDLSYMLSSKLSIPNKR
jgi:hypothetical protein